MKTYVYEITDNDPSKFIDQETLEKIENAKTVLIQIFSGKSFQETEKFLQSIKDFFPKATIITASTDGEIMQEQILTQSAVISISTFEKTTLRIAYSKQKNSYDSGQEIAKKLITDKTRVIITFANGLLCNGEEYLKGLNALKTETIIAGGLTGDNAKFQQCFVGIDGSLYDKGAVAVALYSDYLQVNNLYNFGWNRIGLKHTITKSVQNRIYTIDDLTAVEFYRKYLGDSITDELPKTGIEFPLIIETDNFKKARAVTAKHEDGSLSFTGNVPQGEDVYLGIGEIKTIISNPIENIDTLNVESFFIYSCMARRRFIPDLIYQEIEPFAKTAPTSGFFTYGEFYTQQNAQLLNQTLTAIALSETPQAKQKFFCQHTPKKESSTFTALMHIINVTSKELHEQTLLQEKISNELATKNKTLEVIQEMANLGSWELNLRTMEIKWSPMSYKIHNRDPNDAPPSYEEFINMVLPEDRQKVEEINTKIAEKYKGIYTIELRIRRNDGKIITVVESGKLVFENDEAVKLMGTTLDITDIRMQDAILIQQSKSAQMGEMINMIAHQWRQPLNAISSAVIKLNMQNEMDMLTKEELKKTSKFIEEMTQKMSQTINDFMNFNKPSNQKEMVLFEDIFEDIFKIIAIQLKSHNIHTNIEIEKGTTIYTYKQELEHILMNIISNARDALEESPKEDKTIDIKIYTKEQEQQCIIKIRDNAGGINEDIIDRIFNPYFTTKDSNKGTGLGLYMSKKILQEHLNGDIFVKNTQDGAEFTIILDKTNG